MINEIVLPELTLNFVYNSAGLVERILTSNGPHFRKDGKSVQEAMVAQINENYAEAAMEQRRLQSTDPLVKPLSDQKKNDFAELVKRSKDPQSVDAATRRKLEEAFDEMENRVDTQRDNKLLIKSDEQLAKELFASKKQVKDGRTKIHEEKLKVLNAKHDSSATRNSLSGINKPLTKDELEGNYKTLQKIKDKKYLSEEDYANLQQMKQFRDNLTNSLKGKATTKNNPLQLNAKEKNYPTKLIKL